MYAGIVDISLTRHPRIFFSYKMPTSPGRDIEKLYWEQVGQKPYPIYGADVPGSIMDKNLPVWNFRNIKGILNDGLYIP